MLLLAEKDTSLKAERVQTQNREQLGYSNPLECKAMIFFPHKPHFHCSMVSWNEDT